MPGIVPGTADVQQSTIVNTKFDKTGKPYEQTSTEMLVKADMVFKCLIIIAHTNMNRRQYDI